MTRACRFRLWVNGDGAGGGVEAPDLLSVVEDRVGLARRSIAESCRVVWTIGDFEGGERLQGEEWF